MNYCHIIICMQASKQAGEWVWNGYYNEQP
jgi:hypothetical protein